MNKIMLGVFLGLAIPSQVFASAAINTQNQILNKMEATMPKHEQAKVPGFTVYDHRQESVKDEAGSSANGEQVYEIKEITVEQLPSQFKFLNKIIEREKRGAYTIANINALLDKLNKALMNKGYITSKVYISPQNLNSGTLKLSVLTGKIEAIEFRGAKGYYGTALGFKKGDVLNIHQLEQAVDNLNNTLHQQGAVKLEPGSGVGQSIVVFDIQQGTRFEVGLGMDNFGNEQTGKLQGNMTVAIAKPFNLNDNFYFSGTKALLDNEKRKSTSQYFSYELPLGADKIGLSHSYSDFTQEVAYAIHPFKSSGDFTTDELRWTHLLNRDSKAKTSLVAKVIHKTRHSFINDSEIDVQKRRTTALELGLYQQRYVKDGMVDMYLGYQRGMHWWAEPGPVDHLGDATTMYNLYLGNFTYRKTFQWQKKYKGLYTMELKGQYSTSRLYSSEFLNLAGWYAVRGFNGDNNLSAENGFYIRNTVELPTSKVNKIYFGLDYGKVSGEYSSELLGQELAGGVFGLKGQYKQLGYDIFGAYPISKPDGFKVPNKLFGLQLNITL